MAELMHEQKAGLPPDELLRQLGADFASEAAQKEAEARDLEDRVLQLRAEAAALRKADEGVGIALQQYEMECAKVKEFIHDRDDRDSPARPTLPRLHTTEGYDARAHTNRLP